MSSGAEPAAIIIGGGITGLVCATQLRQAGIDALCLECSNRPGGVLCTRRVDGFLLEAGPNTVQETADLSDLVREVGLGAEILRAPPELPRFVYRRGSLHPLPTSVVAALRTPLVSARAKWRLFAELAIPRRADANDESVEAFVRRRFGAEVVDALVVPFISGTFAGDPAKLSARAVLPLLVALEDRHGSVLRGMLARGLRRRGHGNEQRRTLMSLRDGLESLPARLAARLGEAMRFGSEAQAISRDPADGRFTVEVRDAAGRRLLAARAVVVACSPGRAAPLLEALAPATSRMLAKITTAPLVVVSLAWPRADVSHSLQGVGFLVSGKERIRTLGCLWNSSIFPGRAPAGQASFTAFLGGARDPQAASLSDGALVELVTSELAEILGARGRPRVLTIERHPRALPQYGLGHAGQVAQARAAVGAVPGLFLAGNYLNGVSVGECVRQGARAASDVCEMLRETVDFSSRSV
jgi:protoporphyrinogen/coproporphyrinogen III oxidase